MTWVRIDDQYYDHPKMRQAGALATAMDIAAMCYASRFSTDGFINNAVVPHLIAVSKRQQRECVDALLKVGRWEKEDDGYSIHDFLEYNPSSEVIKAERQYNADRQAAWRARNSGAIDNSLRAQVFKRDNDTCQYCGDKPEKNNLTIDHVVPRSKGGKTTLENLKAACNECNSRKGGKLVTNGPVTRNNPVSNIDVTDRLQPPRTPSPSPSPGTYRDIYIPGNGVGTEAEKDGILGGNSSTDYEQSLLQSTVDDRAELREKRRRDRRVPDV